MEIVLNKNWTVTIVLQTHGLTWSYLANSKSCLVVQTTPVLHLCNFTAVFSGESPAGGSVSGQDTIKIAVCIAHVHFGTRRNPSSNWACRCFFRSSAFTVPLSKPWIVGLNRFWSDSKALSHHTPGSRPLAAMHDAGSYEMTRLAEVEQFVASLVSP